MLLNQNAGRRLHWAWGAILLLAGAAASAQDLYPTPEQAVQALLAGGADPDIRNKDGSTRLQLAALRDETEVLQALLAAGGTA